ncbi:endonuclease/exonuclease/phosphatase family protein [Cellulosimicrobium funkei]|uniref:Endonuclease/exonuclease/phosphatase family protein n=1 Tax=Cellulosimicrobium funkei TaxID=264251 RepID=A0A4Y8R6I5_9MICO|nr:endonuclease/exonuclease/phosphatase family protein [Cellulosimicrobium funkei]TFF16643.1 endonuclease/exonuclease/phosphatase family protein [Cellulosimicrobium funkei]TGA78527.1 endonuclease/exonuclease/phosphatase family protein [Cellulosimicrobium terreum]
MATVRIGTFNVENLFERPRAMAGPLTAGNAVLAAHARVNALIAEERYDPDVRAEILEHLETLGLLRADAAALAVLRQVRGRLVRRTGSQAAGTARTEVVATGRGDWVGWVDLIKDRVDELAMVHTARVVADVGADVLAVVEAESRVALKRFTDAGVTRSGRTLYPHVMVIDGNDDRGIDVGLLTRRPYEIGTVRSHVDDRDSRGRLVFGRDCPEYVVALPGGGTLTVLVNHFKSKGYGTQAESDATRRRQATRTAAIYAGLRARGEEHVVVVGDLNDTPGSVPLRPLLEGTDLRDVSVHPDFRGDGRPGTYGNGTASQKIDYVLLSPALFERTVGGSVFRRGVWGGKDGTLFPHYDTMTSPVHAASDHAALWADVDLA